MEEKGGRKYSEMKQGREKIRLESTKRKMIEKKKDKKAENIKKLCKVKK